ncbi:MAG: vancomycin resistance protein [Ignavibacteriae bacterium]|nr:MAG: vancomycin resistance protein [Ignavibacteriota bacterium]
MYNNAIEKPVNRNAYRKFFGREYYILKRKLIWLNHFHLFASVDKEITFDNSIIKHRSFLLRPLKDVDMYLQHNKVTNLKIAISKINSVIIKPGQIFSIWKLIGRPTSRKGYLEGLTLDNGKISKSIGGGLCQLSNLIYWMTLHTPLTITERWRHAYDVFPDINRKIPFACGATLSYNYIDLQVKNETELCFKINLWLDDEYLNGEITCSGETGYNYEIFETDHCIRQQWWGGYTRHNKIWKRIKNIRDNSQTEKLVTENHAIMMYSPLLEE